MHATRRRALAVLGGGVVIAADLARGRAARAAVPAGTPDALAPWFTAATTETEPRRRALAYAILAPNPHNRQPWAIALDATDGMTVHCDPDRRLPETDPHDRQITIGFGCFLELLSMAAAEQGLRAEIAAFPDGAPAGRLDARPVAHVRLVDAERASPDPLFGSVLDRRSNKAPYAMDRRVAPGRVADLAAATRHGSRVRGTVDPARVDAIRGLTIAGMEIEMATPDVAMESIRLLRIGQAEVDARPDGIDLTGPTIEDLAARGVLTREAAAAELASGEGGPILEQMTAYAIAPMHATPAYLWQATSGDSPGDRIAAGRDYVRLNLAATAAGLAMHPQSQVLQEFEAMAALRERALALLDDGRGGTVQMLCRLGYGPTVPPSPRWPSEARIVEG